MLAKAAAALPIEPPGEWRYEPKWDGFRCVVFRDRDDVVLGSRNERPLTRYFPEIVDAVRSELPERCVVDGEVVIAGHHGLDWDALSNRIHPADSRVQMLAVKTPASLVVFDGLVIDGDDLTNEPFTERRARLEAALANAAPPVHLTPLTDDPDIAQDWFTRFEGAGLDGVVAKRAEGPYRPGERVMVKVKHDHTADCVVAGYRVHKSGDGPGSLLLGLYDPNGTLHHVGVASSFSAARRRALVDELAPYRLDDVSGHPWGEWAEFARAERETPGLAVGASGRLPGAVSRWTATKDLSWEPIRAELVAEVGYAQIQGDPNMEWGPPARFRGVTRFVRWRPDREPESCTYDQLDVVPPIELAHVFGAGAS
jgi:ATP-dependent DNA ligase